MSETDEKIREGIEHVQNAALELIAAARVLLDLAEEAVKDPSDVLSRVNAIASAAATAAATRPAHARDGEEPAVQRIKVV